MDKKTKILATVGPASDSIPVLEGLIRAGVNVFRMNFSHGTHEYHSQTLKNIRQASENVKIKVGVLQDICGPKVRVGKLQEDFHLKEGDTITFVKEIIEGRKTGENSYELCINQPSILNMIKVDDYIYLYDGNIRTKVAKNGDTVEAVVQNSGKLSSNKGVNFPNTILNIDIITKKDEEDLLWGAQNGVDFVAVSFVQNANDVKKVKTILAEHKSRSQVFAKIEKFDAVENIESILDISDGLMIARGDLGIEVPYYKVPGIQKRIIRMANAVSKPVITATQMLLSMAQNETATRAEISDVANAVLDGTDAVMLSEESAIGNNPVNVVEVMANTIIETEGVYPYNKFNRYSFLDETDIISESTAKLSQNLEVDGVITLTSSGMSAKKLARYRIKSKIYAITHDERVARSLTIAWGVNPVMNIQPGGLNIMLAKMIQKGIAKGFIDKNKSYIVTAGYPTGVEGSTNFIRIMKKEQIEYYEDLVI